MSTESEYQRGFLSLSIFEAYMKQKFGNEKKLVFKFENRAFFENEFKVLNSNSQVLFILRQEVGKIYIDLYEDNKLSRSIRAHSIEDYVRIAVDEIEHYLSKL